MKTFKENWSNLSRLGKVQTIISLILVPCVVILSLLGIFNVLPIAFTNSIVFPLLGISFLLSSILYKGNKVLRIALLVCAVLILFAVIVTLVPKIVH